MPTDIWSIPRDPSSGAIVGSYYLRHRTDVTDTLGVVHFVGGRSVEPITGQPLMAFVVALGADVDLEPADDAARRAMWGDEAVLACAPELMPTVDAKPEPVAPVEPMAQPDPEPEPQTEDDHEPVAPEQPAKQTWKQPKRR